MNPGQDLNNHAETRLSEILYMLQSQLQFCAFVGERKIVKYKL